MTDTATQKPLTVSTESTVGPFLDLPYSQVEDVCQLLDRHGIWYRVMENVISFNGGPEMAIIDFGRAGDAITIQAVLDSAG